MGLGWGQWMRAAAQGRQLHDGMTGIKRTHSCIFEVLLRKTSLVVAFAERGGSSVSVLLAAASATPMPPNTAIANMPNSIAEG